GDKYIVKVNLSSPNSWEQYYLDFRDGTAKLVSDNGIDWHNDTNGNWLPDSNQTGYLELKDIVIDGKITQDDLNVTTLSFLSDALDEQFYLVEGNVTTSSDFTPGDDGRGHWSGIDFEITDAITGDWLGWAEVEREDLGSATDTNTFAYKIKLDKNVDQKDVFVRVNYNSNIDGVSSYDGYYLLNDGTLLSDRKIEQRPILKDWNGNDLVENDRSQDECFANYNFWYQEMGSDISSGACYSDWPARWVPQFSNDQNGTISLTKDEPKQIINLDFNALANNAYKLEGTITVPEGFTPNYDWQNHRMIRVEAINADTGMWLGDSPISDTPVDGTTNSYKYSIKLEDVNASTNIIVKLVKEESSADNWSQEAYYLVFNDENNLS
ncbi:MAG: hypothetical protein KAJ49_07665, partial [Arcobacteraceae bacterium]|nr:hypothetical protein [Arcobacteraceae bacterium]